MSKKNISLKPFLKWAGGKRQLLPDIKKHIPTYEKYFEPFVGAAALLFELKPKCGHINDFNSQLIMTYISIRDNLDELIKLLELHKKNNSKEYFYTIRNMDRDSETFEKLSSVERSARLIYLNKTCYNGLYRVNSQGLFNVPFGQYKNPIICDEATLRNVSEYLNSNDIEITNLDFEKSLSDVNKNSFVYFDSPYHSPDNSNFTGYQANGFDEKEQKRLQQVYIDLTNRGVKCLLSNSDTPFIRELYRDFTIETLKATRAINSNGEERGKVNEVLVKNW